MGRRVRIYAETNFLLEIALRQPEAVACAKILRFARAGAVELCVPALCVAEASEHLVARYRGRRSLQSRIEEAVDQIARSSDRRNDRIKMDSVDLVSRFVNLVEREEAQFDRSRRRLLELGAVLPVTASAVGRAAKLELALEDSGRKDGFGRFDAAILGTVLADLAERPAPGACFVTTDAALRKHPVAAEAAAASSPILRPGFADVARQVEAAD